ncbi:MAG: L-glutamate gamma-semialdehyde dehydrogenase [Bacteroidales bacterium]|nr:L-glutamate gamma-semialdehyde dehydrogenase [Bacteroidales bacterium]MDT8432767.1 L-glutamate gamma-semialdehyde dehydrogenase [Bacteroidales bacterium]
MPKGFFKVPIAKNEPVMSYAPGSPERAELKKEIERMRSEVVDIPMVIDGKEVRTDNTVSMHPPHERKHLLGHFHRGDASHVQMAIDAALKARKKWSEMSWEHRASVFLKAAEQLSGPYRMKLNAATMLGQSKNPFQAEIDSAAELIDFFRFNVQYMTDIYAQQPASPITIWDRVEYRPLEGFIFALTPFNFTSIAGNLPSAPAIMGNTVVWKCSNTQVYSAKVIMDIFREAGLPDGVINLVFVSGPVAGNEIFSHRDFAGIHFTGSTEVFQNIWKTIGNNIHLYKSYPRIVGETGGKDFVFVHPTANMDHVVIALVRGAYEYQGQKCSAASRAYIPAGAWEKISEKLESTIKGIKMGPPEDFTNFFNAVIDEASFDKLAGFIDRAKADKDAEVIIGGGYDKSEGFFIEPTVILAKDPKYVTMEEELFGPVLTIYVYDDDKVEETLDILNDTSAYALTGAIFAQDRYAIEHMSRKLVDCAGNFYINDKPTGAVVGQQPFGGARGSGTNDKAGSLLNLIRWVSARTIKEEFVPPTDYRYPFMDEA